MGLKDRECWCCLGLLGPQWFAVVYAYENGNEPSSTVQGREFLTS